jgi:hypothetical protein
MNKTVYLRDEEVAVWEKARELADDKLSPIIVKALKSFISEKEATSKDFKRIVLEFDDSDDGYLPKKKAFYGRWVISPEEPLQTTEDGDVVYIGALAETAKGAIVVFERIQYEDATGRNKFKIFASLSEAAVGEFNYLAREAVKRRGVPVEELDI